MDINKNKELFLQQLFENNYKVDAFPMKFLKTYLGQQKYVRNKKYPRTSLSIISGII